MLLANDIPVRLKPPGLPVTRSYSHVQLPFPGQRHGHVFSKLPTFRSHVPEGVKDDRASVLHLAVVHRDGVAETALSYALVGSRFISQLQDFSQSGSAVSVVVSLSRFSHRPGSTKPAPGCVDGVHIVTCGSKIASAPRRGVARAFSTKQTDQDPRLPSTRSPQIDEARDGGVERAEAAQDVIAIDADVRVVYLE